MSDYCVRSPTSTACCRSTTSSPTPPRQIGDAELHTPPPHEPGVLPRWLGEMGVNLIIAGGMGQRALGMFTEQGIRVITGAPNQEPVALVQGYLAGNLITGPNVCDH